MSGGGGGGNAAAEQKQREEQLRARRNAAIQRLNRMFGVGETTEELGDAPGGPGRKPTLADFYQKRTSSWYNPMMGGYRGPMASPFGGMPYRNSGPVAPMFGGWNNQNYGVNLKYQQALKDWEARNNRYNQYQSRLSGARQTEESRGKRDELYGTIRDDVRNYHQDVLDRNRDDSLRQLKFELARRGHLGGSVGIDQRAEADELYDQGILDIGNLGDQAVNQARSSDEASRLNAIRDINSDVDANTAIQSALASIDQNARQATDTARGANVGNVFQNLGYLYGARRDNDAVSRAMAERNKRFTPSSALSYGSGSGYQGTLG